MSIIPLFLSRNGTISSFFLHLKLELLFSHPNSYMDLMFFSAALFPKCKVSGNGKERSHRYTAACQTRTTGCPSLEGRCRGHSIPKHKVFKEWGWNLENRPAISDVQPQSSLILRGQCSQKIILIPSWTLLWKASKILRGISEWRPKHLCFVNRKSLCLERIFSPLQ